MKVAQQNGAKAVYLNSLKVNFWLYFTIKKSLLIFCEFPRFECYSERAKRVEEPNYLKSFIIIFTAPIIYGTNNNCNM